VAGRDFWAAAGFEIPTVFSKALNLRSKSDKRAASEFNLFSTDERFSSFRGVTTVSPFTNPENDIKAFAQHNEIDFCRRRPISIQAAVAQLVERSPRKR
jgi:hypothetical protein